MADPGLFSKPMVRQGPQLAPCTPSSLAFICDGGVFSEKHLSREETGGANEMARAAWNPHKKPDGRARCVGTHLNKEADRPQSLHYIEPVSKK